MNSKINGTRVVHEQVLDTRAVVHQAAGMISVQLDVPIPVALQRLQTYAADHGQPIAVVAADVVARRLRFDADGMD